jgi:hypothetical protein
MSAEITSAGVTSHGIFSWAPNRPGAYAVGPGQESGFNRRPWPCA